MPEIIRSDALRYVLEVSEQEAPYAGNKFRVISESVRLAFGGLVEGDVAEFGIAGGHSFAVLAATMMHSADDKAWRGRPLKTLHGFDSFQGLPEATLPEDIEAPMVKAGVWKAGACGTPGQKFIRDIGVKFLSESQVQLYPGWFSDTLGGVDPSVKFCCAHIDCDLYESTAQVLKFLFETDRLVDGSILLLDDFLESRGSKKLGQRKAWIDCVEKYGVDFTDLGYYGLASWRCIIHRD